MLNKILTTQVASISDLKKNPMAVLEQGEGKAIAILNHNKPAFYCIPVKEYEELIRGLEGKDS